MTISQIATCDIGTDGLNCSIIDIGRQFLYIGKSTESPYVNAFKVDLSSFSRINSFVTGLSNISTCAIDPPNNLGYFGAGPTVAKIDLSNFTVLRTINIGIDSGLNDSLIDITNGSAYFINYKAIAKVSLSDFSLEVTLDLPIVSGNPPIFPTIDLDNGFIYIIRDNKIIKIRSSDLVVIDIFVLPIGVGAEGVLDSKNGYVYVAVPSISYSEIAKIRLSDATIVDTLILVGYPGITCGVIEPSNTFAYFGSSYGLEESGIYKVRLSDFTVLEQFSLGPAAGVNRIHIDYQNKLLYGIRNSDVIKLYDSDIPSPANITSTSLISDKSTCTAPCDINIQVTWTNTGQIVGTFTPSIKIDGNSLNPSPYPSEALDPGSSVTHTFSILGLMAGSHQICADPDSGTTCNSIMVLTPANVQAGFGPAGMILIAGLAFGIIYMTIKTPKL